MQWATGSVGGRALRRHRRAPRSRAGRPGRRRSSEGGADAGELCGVGPTGVVADPRRRSRARARARLRVPLPYVNTETYYRRDGGDPRTRHQRGVVGAAACAVPGHAPRVPAQHAIGSAQACERRREQPLSSLASTPASLPSLADPCSRASRGPRPHPHDRDHELRALRRRRHPVPLVRLRHADRLRARRRTSRPVQPTRYWGPTVELVAPASASRSTRSARLTDRHRHHRRARGRHRSASSPGTRRALRFAVQRFHAGNTPSSTATCSCGRPPRRRHRRTPAPGRRARRRPHHRDRRRPRTRWRAGRRRRRCVRDARVDRVAHPLRRRGVVGSRLRPDARARVHHPGHGELRARRSRPCAPPTATPSSSCSRSSRTSRPRRSGSRCRGRGRPTASTAPSRRGTGTAVNTVGFVPHQLLRTWVMGDARVGTGRRRDTERDAAVRGARRRAAVRARSGSRPR